MKENGLDKLRNFLKRESLSGMIIPSNDPHFGEYIQDYYKVISYLSGFTGEAGTLVVTLEDAALWTDSRFFIQAEIQLEGSGVELKKLKTPGCEPIEDWLKERLTPGKQVSVDSDLYSLSAYRSLKKNLQPLDLVSVKDPFSEIWQERGVVRSEKIRFLGTHTTGENIHSKHSRVVETLGLKGEFLYLVSACDDVAWLCNIRGNDIDYNPVPLSYAAISRENVYLFVAEGSLHLKEKNLLEAEGVSVMKYNEFENFIADFSPSAVRIAYPDKLTISKYIAATSKGAEFIPDTVRGGVVSSLKAVKNPTEIEGFRSAYILDGVAWVRLLIWLQKRLLEDSPLPTEADVSDKLIELRSESEDYIGESFAPISAWGPNAAMPHYEKDENKPVKLVKRGFLLLDTGGQYTFGTTDTTRTLAMGEISEEQKTDYTLVLKGMINLSSAKFPSGTRGAQLDFLARGEICKAAKVYFHGTGHGIGHALCVHEGPQSIRMEENPVQLEPGMVLSNEPAVYVEGDYGIRIENTILCRNWKTTSWGNFLDFETLTLVPIEKTAIDKKLLGAESALWLNNYHKMVREILSPLLNEDERIWLADKTSDLD